MTFIQQFDFKQIARVVMPFFMYVISLLATVLMRWDAGYFFLRDLPRVGSELCKIACALILGAIALGLNSAPLKSSWLGSRSDADVLAALLLALFTALFGVSYRCFSAIEGRKIWRE